MPRLTRPEAAAEVMLHLVGHDAHGYSQPARSGDGTTETVKLSDGERVVVHGGDYDCSDAAGECYEAVGVLARGIYMWTGNEPEILLANDFAELPFDRDSCRVGDVLWREGHTELVVRPGYQGGFRLDENGGIGYGADQGDQTGYEAAVSPIGTRWTRVYRYVGPEGKWVKNAHGWWWKWLDGSYPVSRWEMIGGDWYWFDGHGYAVHDAWRKSGGKWYWLGSDCRMVKSTCRLIRGKWYAFGSDGAMLRDVSTAKGGALVL